MTRKPTTLPRSGKKSASCGAANLKRLAKAFAFAVAFLWLGLASPAWAQPVRVAVLPFQAIKPASDLQGFGVMDGVASALANTPPFVVVQPQRLEQALKSLKPGPLDTAAAARVGKELGVQLLMTGIVEADKGRIQITARFYDLEAHHSTSSGILAGGNDELFELQTRLVTKFLEAVGVVITQEQAGRVERVLKSTASRRAYDLYLQGRAAQRKRTVAGLTEAIGWYKKAAAEDRNYALAYAQLADAQVRLGQERAARGADPGEAYGLALESAQRAVELAPDLLEARRAQGLASLFAGKLDIAAAEFRRALQLHDNDAQTWYLLWKALDPERTDSGSVQEALQLDPSFIPALRDLGILHYEAGRYDQAIQYFQRALAAAPADGRSRYNLGLAYRRKNLLDKAQAELQQSLKDEPGFADASYALGALYLQRSLPDEAIAAFKAAIAANPRHANAHYYLGGLLLRKGQLEAALTAFQKATSLNPKDADALLNVGNVYLEMGKLQQALAHYQQAAEVQPEYANPQYNLGLALTRLGRNQEAIEAYERYLQLAPKATDARKVRDAIRKLKELH